jgi:hypothetical protein
MDSIEIPNEFNKIIKDFVNDLHTTFSDIITEDKYQKLFLFIKDVVDESEYNLYVKELFDYCKTVFPERFFDILYQNNDMFCNEEINTNFLPELDFKLLWKEDISDNTRETMWKYLQLVLFTIITSVKNEKSFGDTAKLFEAINEDEFKSKLEDTVGEMSKMFENMNFNIDNESNDNGYDNLDNKDGVSYENNYNDDGTNPQDREKDFNKFKNDFAKNLPNAEDIHNHITGMMDGKLGKLAKEIAEETYNDLDINIDPSNADMSSIFKQLLSNPNKIMNLVKNVGSKLDNKIKSGDIKESELLEEASELMNKMKNMPGMGNLEGMLNKMGMPGMPSGGKVNMNAFNQHMQQNMKNAKMRERMKSKINSKDGVSLEELNKNIQEQFENYNKNPEIQEFLASCGLDNYMEDIKKTHKFSTGEKVERSKKTDNPNKKKKKASKK